MKSPLKKIVVGSLPVVMAANVPAAHADEVQSVAAQAIAAAASQPAQPPAPPPPPPEMMMDIAGKRW